VGACVLRMENWFNACGGTISSELSDFLGGTPFLFSVRQGQKKGIQSYLTKGAQTIKASVRHEIPPPHPIGASIK
jgi:hypothetical protein